MGEPATLEPIAYERGPAGGWIVPREERARFDAPPLRPDPPKMRAGLDEARERDPFGCPSCGKRLWDGKKFCGTACYLKARARLT